MQAPSRDEFLQLAAKGRPIPVHRDILADMETPLGAYWKLSQGETYSFLLESVTGGEQLARYSFLGVRPKAVLRSKGRQALHSGLQGAMRFTLADGHSPFDWLRDNLQGPVPLEFPGMPKFIGGAVGMFGYDLVRFIEALPNPPEDDLELDDFAVMQTDSVVVFDHAKNLIRIVVLAEPTSDGYDRACSEIERIASKLQSPMPSLPKYKGHPNPVVSNMDQDRFEGMVRRVKEYLEAGDGIQMVLSQRFATQTEAHPLTIYRALRSLNPSPYMFLLRFGDFDVIGASPEILVSLEDRTARVRPIAGTRPRGESPEADVQLADELLADEKERAEHVMLVDLGRNDLGRVCEFGSVEVNELMVIERYSHVMHIVSDVAGTLKEGLDGIDLIQATFPAGTVSGAPKVRAMEIIDELEPTRRGLYAGAVGYVGANGDLDLAIAIRTILLKSGTAYVQAGAGLVHDSDPTKEFEETRSKARACLNAIEIAQSGLE